MKTLNTNFAYKLIAVLLLFISSQNFYAQTTECYADAVVSNTFENCTPAANFSDPSDALGAPNFDPGNLFGADQYYSMGGVDSELVLEFVDNTLTNDASSSPDLYVYEIGPAVEGTDIWLLPSNAYTTNALDNAGLSSDSDGFYFIGSIGGATATVDIDAFVSGEGAGTLVFNQIKLINSLFPACSGVPGPDIDAVCALSTEPCTDDDGDGVCDEFDNCVGTANADQDDSDCDGVGDACDLCAGGDDSIDNNGDGLPDCAYPPSYNDIISDWKCGNNKAYICHVPPGNPSNAKTKCISKNAIPAHVGNHGGDYLGPCDNVTCVILRPTIDISNPYVHEIEGELVIYPNPAIDIVEINMHDLAHEAGILVISNKIGQVVYSNSMVEIPHSSLKIDISEFDNGIYIASVSTLTGQTITKKFVVMK